MSAAMDDGRPLVTLDCTHPNCEQQITGYESGKGSATWKLGLHLFQKHGVRGSSERTKRRQRAGGPTIEELAGDDGASPILAGVTDIARAIGNNKRVPTEDDLANGIGRGVSLLTIFAASYAADTDPTIAGDEDQRTALVSALSLSPRAGKDLAKPIGRALAPTKLNQRYGRGFVDNVDVIGSLSELATLALHWRQYFAGRREFAQLQSQQGAQLFAFPTTHPAPRAAAPPVQAQQHVEEWLRPDVTTPAPTEGKVWSGAEVQELIRNRNSGG